MSATVIYTMTRGFEPYENQWLGEDHDTMVVDLLQAKIFPTTDDSEVDGIIRQCWEGDYSSVRDLHNKVTQIYPGIRSLMAKPIDEIEYITARRICMQLLEEGILDQAPESLLTPHRPGLIEDTEDRCLDQAVKILVPSRVYSLQLTTVRRVVYRIPHSSYGRG